MNSRITKYLTYQKSLGRSEKTIINYAWRLEYFRDQVRIKRPQDITGETLRDFQKSLRDKAQSTRMSILYTARHFLNWLHESSYTMSDLSMHIESEKQAEQPLEKPLSETEVSDLLEIFQPGIYKNTLRRAILELLYGCGIRRAEAASIKLKDMDFSDKLLTVRGKGNKERIVPIPDGSMHYIELYLEARKSNKAQLFLKENGEPLKPFDIDNLFGFIRKRFPRPVHPHLLRHSYAVHLLRNGADIRILQELLGHESIDDTARYLRLVKEDIKVAYDEAMEGVV
jgi:site-specific recombinase XerD